MRRRYVTNLVASTGKFGSALDATVNECPYCNGRSTKTGFYLSGGNQTQKWRCHCCGRTWSIKKLNRINHERYNVAVSTMKSGGSARSAATVASISKITAARIQRQLIRSGEIAPRQIIGPKRARHDYQKQWTERTGMTQYQRLKWRERLRASVALWLAKNKEPLSVKKIYDAMRPTFPEISTESINLILWNNTDNVFKRVGEKWSYAPSPFWYPGLFLRPNKPQQSPYKELSIARSIWFELNGLRDTATEEAVTALTEQTRRQDAWETSRAIRKSTPQFQLLATAMAINTTNENNR